MYEFLRSLFLAFFLINFNITDSTFNNLLYDTIIASTQSNLRVYKKKSVVGNPLTDHNFKLGLDKYLKMVIKNSF
jgi:hypothetical protein